jgi:hypothetical protein
MCKGDTHGDAERRTIPVNSKRFNSALVISSFIGQGGGLLKKLRGVCVVQHTIPLEFVGSRGVARLSTR